MWSLATGASTDPSSAEGGMRETVSLARSPSPSPPNPWPRCQSQAEGGSSHGWPPGDQVVTQSHRHIRKNPEGLGAEVGELFCKMREWAVNRSVRRSEADVWKQPSNQRFVKGHCHGFNENSHHL